jgi:hypothetical protein
VENCRNDEKGKPKYAGEILTAIFPAKCIDLSGIEPEATAPYGLQLLQKYFEKFIKQIFRESSESNCDCGVVMFVIRYLEVHRLGV